ncbi:26S proteasome non-ATPase regulatory subunit 9 [Pyricularia oryzae Y34]|uniref:26S proteasome non-ATPase regulatory subunit 9 n=2 Tax=Pyricularia oryzae TaxID=318829 RepID=A0AA97PPQ3_PYRO3|nr:26S proteasome non-ATPase regulatory subunit 9 [Pyricularia oryzae Y34]
MARKGPTTAPTANGRAGHLTIAELQRKKDDLEAELRALGGVLESHNVDMNTNLLTPDGFPRADIDVPQIRTTRARIIHLRNDYKDLMATIEKQLHEHFASLNDEEEEDITANRQQEQQASQLTDSVPETLELPFAKVNSVVDNSPADSAGLKAGDLVRNFGYVNRTNHDGLKKVAECVQGNEGPDSPGVVLSPQHLCINQGQVRPAPRPAAKIKAPSTLRTSHYHNTPS